MPRQICLSLGAGVQSTTMALMAMVGELSPMPDYAIFADTGAEPIRVYRHLEWLKTQLPFPVHTVTVGNLRDDLLNGRNSTGGRYIPVPIFLDMGNRVSMGRRQCTREYKLVPIARKQRELLGYRPRQRIPANSVEVWIGISMDEATRMKPARNAWQLNRWPLIERKVTRRDCLQWLKSHGYAEPPKSACTFCPYHNNAMWRDIRDNDPDSWADAVSVDAVLREKREVLGLRGVPYLHRSGKPLDQVDLSGQELDGFDNECEGRCGV